VIGETVAGYRLVARLGAGATGEVYAAEHASVGTKAAIKIIAPELAADPARLQPYLRDAQKASRVNNQGTVKITDVGMPAGNGRGFLVMERLDGETLAARIAASGRLSITQIAEIGRQIAAVIAAMHDDNLVHRDLRPDKIFLVRDSGLANAERIKVLVGDSLLLGATHDRAAPYAAPELWRGEPGDWRLDIYALGCIVFEMATGQRPYSGSGGELRDKHAEYQIPQARSLMPDVPPALDGLIARLMGKQIDQRPKSMREISRELDAFAGPARPLAPTRNDTPAIAVGELNAPTLQPGPARAAAPVVSRDAIAVPVAARSKLPLYIGLAVIVAGILALVLALR
jgi:serine/threonine protein kinase